MSADPARPFAPTPDPARTEDEALDTIAAVLRVLAQTTRTSEAGELLGAWAQHLLVLTPAPAPEGAEPGVRQWSFARTAAVVHVSKEAAATERGLSDLQDVIWAIVESTARIVEDDARLDGRAAACVDRLRSAVGQPPELLRRAALEAVTELADVLNARATRLTPVDGGLADRIATLSAQLDAARLANRFVGALRERPLETPGGPVRIRASVGVSELGPGDTAATAMQRADAALYQAKAQGRDRFVVAPPHQDT